jgi:hypothetical protein
MTIDVYLEKMREYELFKAMIEFMCDKHLALWFPKDANDRTSRYSVTSFELFNTHVCIYWDWRGSYGASDSGSISLPLSIFLSDDEMRIKEWMENKQQEAKALAEQAEEKRKAERVKELTAELTRLGVKV